MRKCSGSIIIYVYVYLISSFLSSLFSSSLLSAYLSSPDLAFLFLLSSCSRLRSDFVFCIVKATFNRMLQLFDGCNPFVWIVNNFFIKSHKQRDHTWRAGVHSIHGNPNFSFKHCRTDRLWRDGVPLCIKSMKRRLCHGV